MSRLLVLGNAGLDIGLDLPSLPQPGETLLGRAGRRAPGGKGLNQAVVAARTALVPVLLRAPIGDDSEGQHVARALALEPFVALELPVLAAPTDLSILMVLPGGENAIVSTCDCAHALSPEDAAAFGAQCGPGDWLLIQGNLLPHVSAAAISVARARGGRIVLNTAPAVSGLANLLPDCDLVIANASEASQLAPAAPDAAAAAAALRDASSGIVIITLGADGCLVDAGASLQHHRAAVVDAVDTTGAGDAFCGVLAATLASGRLLDVAIAAAQRAAALTVTRPGVAAALPTASELRLILAT